MSNFLPEKILYNFYYLAYLIQEKFIDDQLKKILQRTDF